MAPSFSKSKKSSKTTNPSGNTQQANTTQNQKRLNHIKNTPLYLFTYQNQKYFNEFYFAYCTDTRQSLQESRERRGRFQKIVLREGLEETVHGFNSRTQWYEQEENLGWIPRDAAEETANAIHQQQQHSSTSNVTSTSTTRKRTNSTRQPASSRPTTADSASTTHGKSPTAASMPPPPFGIPTHFSYLSLKSCRVGKQTAMALSKILNTPEYGPCIQGLNLHENVIRDDGCIALVQNWLKGEHARNCVVKLDLGSNDISPKGFVPLIQYIMDVQASGNLRELILGSHPHDLYANKMDTKTACMLAKALEINHSIRVLDLNRNSGIGKRSQKAFKYLAVAFSQNESLRELRLGDVDMSTQSAIAILQALSNHEHLRVLDLHANGLSHEIAKQLRRVIVPHRYKHATQVANEKINAKAQIENLEKDMGGSSSPTKGGFQSLPSSPSEKRDYIITKRAFADVGTGNPFESDGDSESDDEDDFSSRDHDDVQESKLSILLLQKNHIGPKGIRILFPALKKNNSLTVLDLASNDIGDEGASYLSEYLETNSSLQKLNLQDNHIGEEGTIAIASSLAANSTLVDLNLSRNKCGDSGVAALGVVLKENSTLMHLNISLTTCGDAGALAIFQSLAVNHTLKTLNISSNHLSEDSGVALEQALKKAADNLKSKSLKGGLASITLTGNQIDHTTLSRVRKIIGKNKTQRQQQKPATMQRELIRLKYITELLHNARESHETLFSERRHLEAELASLKDQLEQIVLKVEMEIQEQMANIEIEQNTIDDNDRKMKIKKDEAKKSSAKFEERISDFESIIQKLQGKRKAAQEKLETVNEELADYTERPTERVEGMKSRLETLKQDSSALEKQKADNASEIEKLQAEVDTLSKKLNASQIASLDERVQKEIEEEKLAEAKKAEEEAKKEEAAEGTTTAEETPSLMEQVKP